MAEVAFDIGTNHTKYAYSIKSFGKRTFESSFQDEHFMKSSSAKTFTSVLLDDTGQFHSFGVEAEYHYVSLVGKHEQKGWRLFGRFASTLQYTNDKKISSCQLTVKDHDGKTYSAMDIFTMAIKYLHARFIADLRSLATGILDSEIMFIFTVQDTWGELGKRLIKDSAIKAGIGGGRLHTVFQSEAIVMEYINNDHTLLNSSGQNYIVINQEGDRIFMAVLQKIDKNTFTILQSETRECVCREQFILERLFDKDVLKVIRNNHTSSYFELRNHIEIIARHIENISICKNWTWIRISSDLRTLCQVESGHVEKGDKIRLHIAEINAGFEAEIGKLINHVKDVKAQTKIQNIQSLIILGDICYSANIRERFAKELIEISVGTPTDPDFAMLQGALIHGHEAFVKEYKDAKNDTGLEQSEKQFQIVTAFDFGTTFSGYGYSYIDDKTKVCTKIWHSNDSSACLSSLKTPTSVLLDDKGQFHSFGFEAEDKFAALAEENKHSDWRLFRCFKMALHSKRHLSRKSTIKDISGKEHEALPIFVMAIQALKKHFMENIQLKVIGMHENDFRYIITVPAIWDVAAKQFMREAAIQAGICSDQLLLAYESEAAALWCIQSDKTIKNEISTDIKSIVIDLGGGTADISVYVRLMNNTIKVIHKASGGAWGSNNINKQFLKYLDNKLGNGVLDNFRENHLEDYLTLTRAFENKKRSHTCVATAFKMQIPFTLVNMLSLKSEKMQIDESTIKSWFEIPIRPLIEHIKILLTEESMKDIKYIILCGGFAESPYVQDRFKNELPDIKLIVPEEAGLAVLKGAVLFGHNPKILASRVMTHTYGLSISKDFDDKTHAEDRKICVDGDWKVENCFEVFVRASEEIPVDHCVSHYFKPLGPVTDIPVFRTLSENPRYTTDPGCELLGSFEITNIPNIPFIDQEIGITFMFGLTELLVKAKHMTNRKEEVLTINCLQ
ncbi:hypothetical protein DPMN_123513 [Dreissena polymorpha]|uniref:Heat shock 70 kDa protein 12A n=1 Tax=Dreissena polymorpha TaxID=45954 RepID=A0A9D4GQH5_DREPO|nr:hypothetical protein DPMN_123513 [Dreissena polymorpha]